MLECRPCEPVRPTADGALTLPWTLGRRDVRIARTPEGKRIRIGEGGNSVVYKAVMHNYDEVALKLVRMAQPSQAELQLFEKEVSGAARKSRVQGLRFGERVWGGSGHLTGCQVTGPLRVPGRHAEAVSPGVLGAAWGASAVESGSLVE